jgi:hypothetical protein
LNLHSFRNQILSLARLPFRHSRNLEYEKGVTIYRRPLGPLLHFGTTFCFYQPAAQNDAGPYGVYSYSNLQENRKHLLWA